MQNFSFEDILKLYFGGANYITVRLARTSLPVDIFHGYSKFKMYCLIENKNMGLYASI